MFRTALKDLAQRKLRLLATGIAVLLGVTFMAGTFVLTDTVGRTFDDLFGSVYAGTDVIVRSSHTINVNNGFGGGQTQRPQIPASLVATVRQVPGVADAVGGIGGYAQLVDKNGKAMGNYNRGAPTLGFTWTDVKDLNPFNIAEGNPPRANDQVVIDRNSANKAHLRVGDPVRIITQSGQSTLKISGIARFGSADSPAGASVALFTHSEAERLLGAPGKIDEVDVTAKPGVSQAELAQRIQSVMPRGVEAVTGKKVTDEQKSDIRKGLSFFTTFLLVFGVVSLIVGAFIIVNTFSIIVAQRTRELALLRALGASRRQVLASVLTEAFTVGLLASLAGLGLGIGAAAGLKSALSAFGVDLPQTGLVVAPRTVIVSLLVGTVVTVLSAILPARRASSVAPVAAMRGVAVDDTGRSPVRAGVGAALFGLGLVVLALGISNHKPIEVGIAAGLTLVAFVVLGPVLARWIGAGLGAPVAAVKGITGRLARQNTVRNPKRTASTASALMIGVALVAFITVFASSAKGSLNRLVDNNFRGDFVIDTKGLLLPDSFVNALQRSPKLAAVAPMRLAPVNLLGSTSNIATDPAQLAKVFDLEVRHGNLADLGPNGIAISEGKANKHHVKIGSVVEGTFVDGTTHPFVVRAIFKLTGGPTSSIVFDQRGVEGASREHGAMEVLVRRASGVSLADARQAIEKIAKPYPTAEIQDASQFKDAQASQMNGLLSFIYVLLTLAVIIALIGIANTLGLAILERTRELGLLRAVGMSRAQTRSTVRWEAVLIAAAGTVLGIVLGTALGSAIVKSLPDNLGLTELVLPGGQLLTIGIIGLLVGVIAAIWPARRAAKLDVLAAIADE